MVHASNENKTTMLADIVFRLQHLRKEWDIRKFQGEVQRIHPAVATVEMDRALDGMEMSRWDKFGTEYDRWMQGLNLILH